MNSKIITIKALRPEDRTVRTVMLYKIENEETLQVLSVSMSITEAPHIREERRIQELNKNIEQAKIALDNYTHQHQSILYRLRNFFRHVTR